MYQGWLVNDQLCAFNIRTFWHDLLEWFPNLIDCTNGYTDFKNLANTIEKRFKTNQLPTYIIRNGTYFRKINTPSSVKTISLIQDVLHDKSQQIDVINHSTIVVFNTEYVYQKYKHLITKDPIVKICPLGIDFELFQPISIDERHPDVLPDSILFIGSSQNYPKGFNILLNIIQNMKNRNFCLIMKDNFNINQLPSEVKNRVKIFNLINSETVCRIINSCIVAVCTSYEETQHLSGIECGACNIPIVAREVGFYYDCRNDSDWGCLADDSNFTEKIEYVIQNRDKFHPREYLKKKYSKEICKNNWIDIVKNIN